MALSVGTSNSMSNLELLDQRLGNCLIQSTITFHEDRRFKFWDQGGDAKLQEEIMEYYIFIQTIVTLICDNAMVFNGSMHLY